MLAKIFRNLKLASQKVQISVVCEARSEKPLWSTISIDNFVKNRALFSTISFLRNDFRANFCRTRNEARKNLETSKALPMFFHNCLNLASTRLQRNKSFPIESRSNDSLV